MAVFEVKLETTSGSTTTTRITATSVSEARQKAKMRNNVKRVIAVVKAG